MATEREINVDQESAIRFFQGSTTWSLAVPAWDSQQASFFPFCLPPFTYERCWGFALSKALPNCCAPFWNVHCSLKFHSSEVSPLVAVLGWCCVGDHAAGKAPWISGAWFESLRLLLVSIISDEVLSLQNGTIIGSMLWILGKLVLHSDSTVLVLISVSDVIVWTKCCFC